MQRGWLSSRPSSASSSALALQRRADLIERGRVLDRGQVARISAFADRLQ